MVDDSVEKDLFALLDEAVLLYSALDCAQLSSDEQIANELKDLRKRELTSLVQDAVTATRILPEPTEEESTSNFEDGLPIQTMSLMELSLQLDRTILEGYESTFSEEELTAWTLRIESIRDLFEEKLKRQERMLAPSPAQLDDVLLEYKTRLGYLQDLVPLPATWKSMTVVAQDGSNPNSEKSEERQIAPACNSTIGVGKEEDESLTQALEAQSEDASALAEADHQPLPPKVQSNTGVDTVSAVISAAALGAAAVTHIPFFAAGIALSPLVKETINYAKTQFQQRRQKDLEEAGLSRETDAAGEAANERIY